MAMLDDQHKGECNHIAASKNKISETYLKMRFIYVSNFDTKDSTSDFRFDIEKASKMKHSVLKPPMEEDLQVSN